jgi:glutamyl-tRNA synthetase
MSDSAHSSPRVRFAPSPTGYLHVGGARTALFNWLFARHFGGTFILRIEDTDFERSSEEMVQGILDGMSWLGLSWDEGPFFQSQRLDLYSRTAEQLIAAGHAYYCFCAKEELEQRRAQAAAAGRPPMYDRRCRSIDPAESQRRRAAGQQAAVRFSVPDGSTSWDDAVFGRVEFANTEIEDFVLLRSAGAPNDTSSSLGCSDGIPTYHLSVVADDIDMRLTHIIRGADHISNTPKQILQYRALGAPLPVFAHVPLILGPDKTRLSKRHGATSVMAYKEMGIVPEAFRNFLALLGWSPGPAHKDREIFSSDDLIQLFSLDGISKSNAVFDNDKLAWFNTEYIRAYDSAKLVPLIEAEWRAADFQPTRSPQEILAAIDLLKPRARSLKDFAGPFRAYFGDSFEFDPAAVAKFLADPALPALLRELAARYAAAPDFTEPGAEEILRAFAAEKGMKAGALINGSRVALTGQAVAPSLFAVMAALGRDRTVHRLAAVNQVPTSG